MQQAQAQAASGAEAEAGMGHAASRMSSGKKQKVDLTTASMIVSMIKQLNSTNQKKVLNMLDNSRTFKDVAKFAFSAGK